MSDPTKVSRRLVAVFAADVEGYSRLMGADEVGTLKGLTERRAILDRLIGEHRATAADGKRRPFGGVLHKRINLRDAFFGKASSRLARLMRLATCSSARSFN